MLLILILVFAVFVEIAVFVIRMLLKSKKTDDEATIDEVVDGNEKAKREDFGRFHGVLRRERVHDFLGFDSVDNGMIIRKDRKEFIMVLLCNGVNFDLRSEREKLAIEEGFLQFLNTLKNPVQLYVQTRSLNFTDIIKDYKDRTEIFKKEIDDLAEKMKKALATSQEEKYRKYEYLYNNKRRLWEYAQDTLMYTERLNRNRNVLEQKTYIIVSYYAEELGQRGENYTQEERESIIFSELFTRCNNISNALRSSSISSRVLNSEELVELLFNAFNRDELENINLKNYLENEADKLYTTSQDVLNKRKRMLQEEINIQGIELATQSITKADKKRKKEIEELEKNKNEKIKEKAKVTLEQYKSSFEENLYKDAQNIIDETEIDENGKFKN
jgi:hypothetical protein